MKFYQEWYGRAVTESGESEPFKSEVPGNIQNDYAKSLGLGDLNYGSNCTEYKKYEGYTWQYISNLQFDSSENERIFFVSRGIDYYSSVSLNGKMLTKHEGCFSDIEIDITDYISDKNELIVTVYPHPKRENAVKNTRDEADSCVKPPVCYGWDWHPRLLVSGMWQEAYIETRAPESHIGNVDYSYKLSDDLTSAVVEFKTECKGEVTVEISDKAGNTVYSGDGKSFTLNNISLWWCNGQGEPYLYSYKISSATETKTGKIGFRKIELWMDNSEWGKPRMYPMSRTNPPTCIVLNGRKIFAKGSNFATPEIFPGTVTKERYTELLTEVRDAHMNILRMWGGCGIQKNVFYELCDEMGIMIWQEFPLACNRYGIYDAEHYNNVLASEARSIIGRLHPHPCLVLLCGGNELFNNWSLMTDQSIPLRLLDCICLELCPEIPFIMTSPLSGMAHGPYAFWVEGMGDVFEAFQKSEATAYTEFGGPSLSSPEYLKTFIPEKDLENISSAKESVWTLHHAFSSAKGEGQELFGAVFEHYGLARSNLDEIYQNSTWLQCEGVKSIFEESRRQWPTCCMAINWFFNEPWKVAVGNSLILYPNNKKAAYYEVKRALRPVAFTARIPKFDWKGKEKFTAELWFLNDTGRTQSGKVKAYILIDGNRVDLGSWDTGDRSGNALGPSVNYMLPECDATTLTLVLEADNGMGNEYTLRFYPTYKKKKNALREMNSTNDL